MYLCSCNAFVLHIRTSDVDLLQLIHDIYLILLVNTFPVRVLSYRLAERCATPQVIA
jgi:hypothetical protein